MKEYYLTIWNKQGASDRTKHTSRASAKEHIREWSDPKALKATLEDVEGRTIEYKPFGRKGWVRNK